METSGEQNYAYDMKRKRKRKRKVQFDEVKENEVELSGRDRFRVTVFHVIIDRLIAELQRRGSAYEKLSKKFDFLTKLHSLEFQDVRDGARNLCKPSIRGIWTVLWKTSVCTCELICCPLRLQGENGYLHWSYTSTSWKKAFWTIPNVGIALRMLLCTPGSNCSAERSFSALK